MQDEVERFMDSPAWEYSKAAGGRAFTILMREGLTAAWDELMIAIDPEGETHAYRVCRGGADHTYMVDSI